MFRSTQQVFTFRARSIPCEVSSFRQWISSWVKHASAKRKRGWFTVLKVGSFRTKAEQGKLLLFRTAEIAYRKLSAGLA